MMMICGDAALCGPDVVGAGSVGSGGSGVRAPPMMRCMPCMHACEHRYLHSGKLVYAGLQGAVPRLRSEAPS